MIPDWVYLLLLIPLGLAGLIAFAVWQSVNGLVSPDGRLAVLTSGEYALAAPQLLAHENFADQHGLEWVGAFRTSFPNVPSMVLAAWRSPGDGPTLAAYLAPSGEVMTDVVSMYAGERGLTTCNGAGAALFPCRPGKLRQVLPGRSLPDLWAAHSEADDYARRTLGFRPWRDPRPVEEQILESVRAVGNFAKSYPLWPLLGVYWFLTQSLRTGKTVLQQGLRADAIPMK